MKLLRQVCIVTGICFLGELLQKLLKVPVPGNILGMIILFICLCTGIVKIEWIKELSDFLLEHLSFFFVPAGVGLIVSKDILQGNWTAFLSVCLITTIIVIVVTGYTVQFLKRSQSK